MIFYFTTKILSKMVKEYFATEMELAMTSYHNDLIAFQCESRIKIFQKIGFGAVFLTKAKTCAGEREGRFIFRHRFLIYPL
ncbi:hypothetical protein N665_0241s0040 [Sinapis alba]|nr:hypothetical protein N665_0241s0040 [Sinapis alba]